MSRQNVPRSTFYFCPEGWGQMRLETFPGGGDRSRPPLSYLPLPPPPPPTRQVLMCPAKFTSTKLNTVRTSDGGNGNHSVSLPIILIKFKVNQMIPSSYKLADGLYFMILHLISYFHICTALFGVKMVTFCIIHIGNRKIFFKHHPPPPRVPTNPFARKCVLIFYIIYVKS